MKKEEFSQIRHHLGKSQSQLAKLLGISSRTVQSFEQGWRNVPPCIERQLLLLLSLSIHPDRQRKPCWELKHCPDEWRAKCAAWEFKASDLCWFINGTFCNGQSQENWKRKIELCRQCKVFQPLVMSEC